MIYVYSEEYSENMPISNVRYFLIRIIRMKLMLSILSIIFLQTQAYADTGGVEKLHESGAQTYMN